VNDGPNTPPESIGASPPDVILVLSPFAAKVLSKVIEEAHAEDIVDLPDSALRDLGLTVPDDDEDSDDFFDALTERIEGLFLALPPRHRREAAADRRRGSAHRRAAGQRCRAHRAEDGGVGQGGGRQWLTPASGWSA
jgi:uncharacterized protein YjeT (DUF2065 family)